MHKGMRAEPQDKALKPKCIFFCKRLYGSNERQPESKNIWFRGWRFFITGNKGAESDGLKLKMRIRKKHKVMDPSRCWRGLKWITKISKRILLKH